MTEQQERLYRLLKEIDDICRKHDIVYYLAGGTCIGTLRHRGFLPWDDDMDLYMTRKNWEKFIEVSKYDFPEDRVLLCPELVPTYTNLFGRYCDVSTTALHRHNLYAENVDDDPCGYIVDILPLDPIPYTEDFYKKYAQKICILSDIINVVGNYSYRYQVKPSMFGKYVWKSLWNREQVIKELFNDLFKYDEKDCDYFAMRWGGVPLLFPKEWFQEPTEWQFETMTAMMPTMNNAYLTMHYGDAWSYVPDVSEQEGHVAVHRTDIPYYEFRKKYAPYIKQKNIRTVRVLAFFYKLYRLCMAKKENKKRIHRKQTEALKLIKTLGAENPKTLTLCRQYLNEDDIFSAGEILAPIVRLQMSPSYIGREDFKNMGHFNHPVLIDMSDELFELLLSYLMKINKTWAVLRLIGIREKKADLTEAMKDLREDILAFRDAVDDYDMHEYSRSLIKAEKLAEKYPTWSMLLKLRIRLFLYKQQGDMEVCKNLLNTALSLYHEDGEFIRYKYEMDKLCGMNINLDELVKINYQVINSTRNGIVWLAVRDEMAQLYEQCDEKIHALICDGKLDEAEQLVSLCRGIYLEPWAEKLMIMALEIESVRAAQCESNTLDENNAELMDKIKAGYRMSGELKDVWAQLYLKNLTRLGYGGASEAEIRLADIEGNYNALVEAERQLTSDDTAGVLLVHGNYLYALGRITEAYEKYAAVLTCENVSSYQQYMAKACLTKEICWDKEFVAKHPKRLVDSFRDKTFFSIIRRKIYPLNQDWNIVKCVNYRDQLCALYAARKPFIMELWKNNERERVKKELAEYHFTLKKYLDSCKIAIVTDKELFEIYLDVFYEGKKKYWRKKIIKKIPVEWRAEVGL